MASEQSTITLQQSLFGYQDGHRLLATSLKSKLDEESSSRLLTLSDLVSGGSEIGDGYWTGLPLPRAKVFALIRTWPAPEMSRPGCVWSHAIFIGFADMGRIRNLATVARAARRPSAPMRFDDYTSAVMLDDKVNLEGNAAKLDRFTALRLVRAVYDKETATAGAASEEGVFALWSQQWPRLRRSFSFRTAGAVAFPLSSKEWLTKGSDGGEFRRAASEGNISSEESWETAAVDDLLSESGQEFRQFAWRYGSDVKDGRKHFKLLADLFVEMRHGPLDGERLRHVLSEAVSKFPDGEDGALLKRDLMSAGQARFSLVPPCDALDVLEFYESGAGQSALPAPAAGLIDQVGSRWPRDDARILRLTNWLVERRSESGYELARRLARSADESSFLSKASGYASIVRLAVAEVPELLDDSGVTTLPSPLVAELIGGLPDDFDRARSLIGRLMGIDDVEVARSTSRKYPQIVVENLVGKVAASRRGEPLQCSAAWIDAGKRSAKGLSDWKLFDSVTTMSELGAWIELMDYNVAAGRRMSADRWAGIAKQARNDTKTTDETVAAFLLIIGTENPVKGCEPLFERFFPIVHRAALGGRMQSRAHAILDSHLPLLSWWRQWDLAGRLRLGVASAYVSADLDPGSLSELGDKDWIRDSLFEAAEESAIGRDYVRRNQFRKR